MANKYKATLGLVRVMQDMLDS